jgi:hypothetical protein
MSTCLLTDLGLLSLPGRRRKKARPSSTGPSGSDAWDRRRLWKARAWEGPAWTTRHQAPSSAPGLKVQGWLPLPEVTEKSSPPLRPQERRGLLRVSPSRRGPSRPPIEPRDPRQRFPWKSPPRMTSWLSREGMVTMARQLMLLGKPNLLHGRHLRVTHFPFSILLLPSSCPKSLVC